MKIKKEKEVLNAIGAYIDALTAGVTERKKKLESTIDDEARAAIDLAISEREKEIDYLSQLKSEAEQAEEDKSVEVLAKLKEMQEKFREMEKKETETMAAASLRARSAEDYLKSAKATKDYADCLKNSKSREGFRAMWHEKLVSNGITPTNVMLPGGVVQAISDAWSDEPGRFLNMLNFSGLKYFKALIETSTADTSKAHMHTKGGTKTMQELTLTAIELRASTIYKILDIDKETEHEDENGVLVEFITRELVNRIGHFIAEEIAKGGTANCNVFGCSHTAGTFNVYKKPSTESLIYAAGVAADKVESGGRKVLLTSRENYTALRTVKWNIDGGTGGGENYLLTREQAAGRVGVDDIIVLRDFDTYAGITAGDKALGLVLDTDAYMLVGNRDIEEYRDFKLEENKLLYLAEMYVGGGLIKPNAACYITETSA